MKKQYFFSLLVMLFVGFGLSAQQLVSDINASGGSDPNFFTEYDGLLFFSADDGINGRELWAYDPNTQTSSLILDLNPGAGSSDPSGLYVFDGKLVFGTDFNNDLVVYDRQVSPATVNTYVIGAGSNRIGNQPRHYTELNGNLYFSATFGLYRFNGSTVEYILINNRAGAISGSFFVNQFNGVIYIDGPKAPVPSQEDELFFFNPSDNTSGIVEIGTGTVSGVVSGGLELLSSDRLIMPGRTSNATAKRLVLFDPVTSAKSYISSAGFTPTSLKALGNILYCQAGDNTNREFYRYEPGTGPVVSIDMNPTGSSNPALFTEFNGTIFFRADNGTTGVELHYYDDTTGNFGPVFDLNSGSGSSTPKGIVVFNNELYFGADDGSGTGFELWKYNGSLPCPTPTNVAVSNVSFFDADLSWTGSTDATNGYVWYVMEAGETPGVDTPAASGGTPTGTTSASAANLSFGTNYDVYVEALCSSALSSLSAVVSFTTLTCESATNLTTTNITDTTVSASWTASATAFNGYNWYLMNPGEVPGQDTVLDNGIVTTTDVTVTGLTASTAYDLYIQSRCATGFGSALSTFVSFTTTASCAAPTNVTASNVSETSLDLSWIASPDATNGYRWYILPSGSTDTAQAIETNVTTATSVTGVNASNLTAGTSYDAYVVSRCSATVNSGLSLVETFTIPSPTPLITMSGPISVSESIGSYNVTVTASQVATSDIDFTIGFGGAVNGNATFGVDYDFSPSNIYTIEAGTTSTTFNVVVIDDNELESLERILLDILSVTNGQENGVQEVETLIEDNEQSSISFTDSGQTLVTLATDVVLDEFDGNAGLDAFFTKDNFSDRLFSNNGSGVLTNTGQTIGTEDLTLQVATGNFVGSSNTDVVLAKAFSCQVLLNNSGTYSPDVSFGTVGTGSSNRAVATTDIDFDGLDDIIIGKVGEIEVYINDYITNNFMLDFSLSQTLSFGTNTSQVNDIKIGNFSLDNNPDIVVTSTESSYVFYGIGGGQFDTTAYVLPNADNASGVDITDIDNNGSVDFVFAQALTNDPNQIVLNDGSVNGFSLMPLTPRTLGAASDVAFVDLDNDGDKDIIFSNAVNQANTFWENIGGTFVDNGFFVTPAGISSNALDVGDIDGDGDMDVIFANGGTTSATSSRIWFNDLQTLSNNELEISNNFKLYPNPVNNEFSIATKGNTIDKLEVYNLQGQLIKQFNSSEYYDISQLESGLYLVNVYSNTNIETFKIIKN